MKNQNTNKSQLVLLVIILWIVTTGDKWSAPEKTTIYSENKKFQFIIIPKGFSKGLGCSGADSCLGILFSVDLRKELWCKPLINEWSPVNAFVANSGKTVVTLDDWYTLGYGENALVVYDSLGNVAKRYSLEALLTPQQIERAPHTVSSIWWRETAWFENDDSTLAIQLGKEKQDSMPVDTIRVQIYQ